MINPYEGVRNSFLPYDELLNKANAIIGKALDALSNHESFKLISKTLIKLRAQVVLAQRDKITKYVGLLHSSLIDGKVLKTYQETLGERSQKEVKTAVTLLYRQMLDCQCLSEIFASLYAKQIDANKDYIDESLLCESNEYIELQLRKITYIKSEFRKFYISNEERVSHYFEKIKNTPLLLSFIHSFPKAETHAHLTGDIDPRKYVEWAIEKDLYFTLVNSEGVVPDLPDTPLVELAKRENLNFKFSKENTGFSAKLIENEVLDEFCKKCSIKHISGNSADHFFRTFINFESLDEFLPYSVYLEYLSIKADEEEIFYRELSKGFENKPSESFSTHFPTYEDFVNGNYKDLLNEKLNVLCESLQDRLKQCFDYIDEPDQSLFSLDNDAIIRLNIDVSRELPLPRYFADLVLAFLFVQEEMERNPLNPRVVGIVISGREDKPQCLKDRDAQLKMIAFLKEKLFCANISPHAGELSEKVMGSLNYFDAITSVLETINPPRMGHCTSFLNTTREKVIELFRKFKQNHICIEICPTSNEKILDVIYPSDHPLPVLIEYGIPVTINTDDAGVNGITLAKELKRTIERYKNIDYATFKAIQRNQPRYCFMPGEGIWEDSEPYQFNLRPDFRILIEHSPKAKLQYAFEQRISKFEQTF